MTDGLAKPRSDGDTACMVQAAWRYSRFLFVESCGQCPACKFGTGEVTQALQGIEAGGGSDRDLELILVRARGATGGQKCALPTGESLLMQSLVQAFGDEFAGHVGRPCPLPRELPFHKVVDWDAAAGRFAYDLAYAHKQPDWAYSSRPAPPTREASRTPHGRAATTSRTPVAPSAPAPRACGAGPPR